MLGYGLRDCDHEGAKSCLMTGASSNRAANNLLRIQAANELKTGIVPWIARVPSKSNIADDPSLRLQEQSGHVVVGPFGAQQHVCLSPANPQLRGDKDHNRPHDS